MFDAVDPKQSLPDLERGILKYWREEDAFKRSLSRRKGGEVYSFYDGPPFATGLPHYGHILAGTIKDVIPRYQTMRGKYVRRRFGWDCHGLPIENLIEKEQNLKSKKNIEELGVGKFNDLCRGAVQRYTKEWRDVVERMGRWVDMDHDYRTMDPEFMESIWWVFKSLYDQGLIYEGHKPMHICPRCATPLSNFEVTQGYKDIQDFAVTARFELLDERVAGSEQRVGIEFRPPESEEEWNEIHRIRKEELFSVYHPSIVYDPSFATDGKTPDDRRKENTMFVLLSEGTVIGTMRIDLLNKNDAAFRLIAIDKRYQKKGLGNTLMERAEEFVRSKKRKRVLLHAEKPVVAFYKKHGFSQTKDWKEKGMGFMDMQKDLGEKGAHVSQLKAQSCYFLAWTTTAWTLPGNLFLAVHPDVQYVTVGCEGGRYIVAKDLVESVFKGKEYSIESEQSGKDLIGKKYKPLFPYFADQYAETAFRVVAGDFVTTTDGTGIVHVAPGYGSDDFEVGKREKIEMLQHVGMDGTFVSAVKDFAGMQAKPKDKHQETDKKIAEWLKKHGKLFKAETFSHSYPHCWRCDSPLLNYATSSWFVAVEKVKEKMLASNSKTQWVPGHIRDGRFGKWLEGARDWAISRNRFWGTPLPIWKNSVTGEIEVIGSRDELMRRKPERFAKIIVARHAESRGNVEKIYQGKVPGTNLTDNGKAQAKTLAANIKAQAKDLPVSVIYCSPLTRTQETAQAIADATGATIVIDERLREVAFGDYEGKHIDFDDLTFIRERRAHKMQKGKVESIFHFEGMETWDSVEIRVNEFLDDILPKHAGQMIAIVTHADVVMNFTHAFTGEDPHKIVHQPYPETGSSRTFYWDYERRGQMDLHKETVDEIAWSNSKFQKPNSKDVVELTLIRHGETDLNKQKIVQGSELDMPLNKVGKEQARKAGEDLKGQQFDIILSSHMKRAVETAKIIAKEIGIPYGSGHEILRERDLGEWTGKKILDILAQEKAPKFQRGAVLLRGTPAGGESLNQFIARAQKAHDWLLKEYAGKKVLLIAHGGFNRAFMMVAQNLPYEVAAAMEPKNAHAEVLTIAPQMRRIDSVLDCWFESGSMPYAQEHFPFEHGSDVPPGFPAEFIAEGLDQTRGWFYTLMVLSSALFGCPPFRHCIVNGIVLAEDGKKMSKKLKNYPEPTEIAEKHGADAVRFALMGSPAVRGEDLRFSEKLVEETVRSVLLPLWNAYRLFVTYANAADFKPSLDFSLKNGTSTHLLDQWILKKTQALVNRMTAELEAYDLSATCGELSASIDDLTNWYVRLSRRRLAGKDEGQKEALDTLYRVLLCNCQLLAPFCPFITEDIYLNLVGEDHGSIHFTDWPLSSELTDEDKKIMTLMDATRTIVTLGLSLRSDAKIRVRQPLQSVTFALPPSGKTDVVKELIAEELNVKEVIEVQEAGTLGTVIAMVDARKVGPRLGARVQEVIKAGKAGQFEHKDGSVVILGEALSSDEVKLVCQGAEGKAVAADHGIVVAIDPKLSDALKLEGQARELIHAVQQLRKDAGLDFTDSIVLSVAGLGEALATHGSLILEETKATLGENDGPEQSVSIDGISIKIRLRKQ